MTFEIRNINVTKLLEQGEALFLAHREELTTEKDIMEFDPDVATYRVLEECGKLVSLGAYAGDVLVGYSINIVSCHLHYRKLLYASNDVLYLAPDFRNQKHGNLLIDATELACHNKGAQMLLWHAKPDTALSVILPRKGYKVQDIIYMQRL